MKMHKNPIASRPIASCINTITENCSKYLDTLLQPIMNNIKTHIKSSTDVIRKLNNAPPLPPDCVILCADVEALYPSIPITPAIAAISQYLKQYLNHSDVNLICDLMHWVLTNNYLEYGDLLFLQVKGTAMGTPFAVVFANLFLAHLEETIINPQLTDAGATPLISFRFIDDIFAIFNTTQQAERYRTLFSTHYPTIKTTGTISKQSGIFLDIELYKGYDFQSTQHLDTKLYQKATNKYLYLSPATYHPKHVLTGYISSELNRYRINCSNHTHYYTARTNFYNRLTKRHYPTSLLDPLFFMYRDRSTLLNAPPRTIQPERPTFCTTLGPDLTNTPLCKLLDPKQTLLYTNEYYEIFNKQPPLLAVSHPNNIGKQLIRAKVSYP